jgi:hypothetical protein
MVRDFMERRIGEKMRIAVLIMGLLLGLLMFLQTLAAYVLSDAINDDKSSEAAAVGILMALLWLGACALVIGFPRVSIVLFVSAGVLGFAASGDFPDLGIWGGVSLVLAGMSYLGHRGKRKQQAKERERDEMIRQGALAQQQLAQQFASSQQQSFNPMTQERSCYQCGAANNSGARYCGNCGAALISATA